MNKSNAIFKSITKYKNPAELKTSGNTAFFQPKLTINQPHDVYEQEADAMADKVMGMRGSAVNNSSFFKPSISSVQRKCKECEEEEKKAQRKESNDNKPKAPVQTDNYINSLSGGSEMNGKDKAFFESHMGYDFSDVKIHTGSIAAKSAESINALAFTSGNNIVFASNQYKPETDNGKRLLAHELTHVIQQSGMPSHAIQRQPGDDAKELPDKDDVVSKLENDTFFKKLEKKIQDEIKTAIHNAPEKITQAVIEKIIDATVSDPQYNQGLKKAAEAIIKTITGKKTVSTSKCDAVPGFHEGGSRDFKGQCCNSTVESAQACCPKDKFAPNNAFSNCCKSDEFVNSEGKCEKQGSIDVSSICISPGRKDSLGNCCMPPLEVIDGICTTPPDAEPKTPPPFSLKFIIGVIDDYNIDESLINGRQKPHFGEVTKQIHQFMEACPASMITITGFADKPGTEEHNMDLGQRRADYVKTLLQLDLMKINFSGLSPLIISRSEGENNPVDINAGEKYSSANRRVEIEFSSLCPSLGAASAKPLSDEALKIGAPIKLGGGVF